MGNQQTNRNTDEGSPVVNKNWKGTLTLNIHSANNLLDKDIIGKSDPYCKFTVATDETQLFEGKTITIPNNVNPRWRTPFTRQINGVGPITITFFIYDEDYVRRDFLGHFVYKFQPKPFIEESHTVNLTDKTGGTKKNRGTLTFIIWYTEERILPRFISKDKVFEMAGSKKSSAVLGPWLLFRKSSDEERTYSVDILILTNKHKPPDFSISPRPVNKVIAKKLLEFEENYLWRYSVVISRHQDRLIAQYRICKKESHFTIPAENEPLRFIVVSCNGFHEEPKDFKKEKFYVWKLACQRSEEIGGYHIIIQGGDQVYADPVWKLPELKDIEPGHPSGAKRTVSPEFLKDIEKFYMNLYINSWGGDTDLSKAYATVPSVMMWDDHDVFDGWGSYPDKLMNSELYKALGGMAERYFVAFQLGATMEEAKNKELPCSMKGNSLGYSQMYRIDQTGIACLDLRSERHMKRVCTQETYDDFIQWIKENAKNMNHLLLVLSIPIVYNDFDMFEKVIATLGVGEELKDDLQDHWRTKDHRKERLYLLKLLLHEAEKGKFRVTILSGDVHISCAGVVYDKIACKKSNAAIINSLISSAVVNIPPPPIAIKMLELTGSEIETVEKTEHTYIKAGLYRLLGDPRQSRYFGGRNYLELAQNSVGGTHARWFVEDHENEAFQLYINPYKETPGHMHKLVDRIIKDSRLRKDETKFLEPVASLLSIPWKTISGWFK